MSLGARDGCAARNSSCHKKKKKKDSPYSLLTMPLSLSAGWAHYICFCSLVAILVGALSDNVLGLLDGLDEGSFLVRRRGAVGEEHVLSVVHKGKPSHHLIKQTQDGTWSLNGKVFGQPATIHEVSRRLIPTIV